jgi:hypothetical protein
MLAVVESSSIAVYYSVPCGLTWDADGQIFVGAPWGEGERLLSLENRPLNGRSKFDFLNCFPAAVDQTCQCYVEICIMYVWSTRPTRVEIQHFKLRTFYF